MTVISEPSTAGTIGSFYAFVDGGTLIVAQALAEPVAEAAFEELRRRIEACAAMRPALAAAPDRRVAG